MARTEPGVWRRRVRVDSDGTGPRWHDVYVLPASGEDYWASVTDVPCPIPSCSGVVRWAEGGAVPGWRRCDGRGRHEFLAVGSASAPALRRQVRR